MIHIIDTKRLAVNIRDDCIGIGIVFIHKSEIIINILCLEICIDLTKYKKEREEC